MKNKLTIAKLLLAFTFSWTFASAQYSNASLNDAWIFCIEDTAYILFDGNGKITEMGVFGNYLNPLGTYTVSSGGTISATFTALGNMTMTGNMTSANSASVYLDMGSGPVGPITLIKVMNTGALTETLSGTFTDVVTSVTKNVSFTVNNNGRITVATGLPNVNGRIYTQNGIVAGFVYSSDTDCEWKKFRINGSYSNNVLSGYFGMDCNDSGTYVLNRTGMVSSSKEIKFQENVKIFPNPFIDKLTIDFKNTNGKTEVKILNVLGKEIFRQSYKNADKIELNEIENLPDGIYFLQMTFDNEITVTKKMVRSR